MYGTNMFLSRYCLLRDRQTDGRVRRAASDSLSSSSACVVCSDECVLLEHMAYWRRRTVRGKYCRNHQHMTCMAAHARGLFWKTWGRINFTAGAVPRAKAWRGTQTDTDTAQQRNSTTTPPPRRRQPTDLCSTPRFCLLDLSSTIPSFHPSPSVPPVLSQDATKSATSLNHHNRLNSPDRTTYLRVHKIHCTHAQQSAMSISCPGQGVPDQCLQDFRSQNRTRTGQTAWDWPRLSFVGLLSPPFFLPLTTGLSSVVLPASWGDLVARRQPTSTVTTWDDFLSVDTPVGSPHRHHDICPCPHRLRDSLHHGPIHFSPLPRACVGHATATATVAAPNPVQPACSQQCRPRCCLACIFKQPTAFLSLCPLGEFLSSPPPFCPFPSLRHRPVHSQARESPRRLPCLFELASEGHRRASRASAKPLGRRLLSRKTIASGQKKLANATPGIFNTLRVICPPITRSRFSATCTECCKHPEAFSTLSCDMAIRLFTCLTRRTSSLGFLPWHGQGDQVPLTYALRIRPHRRQCRLYSKKPAE